MSLRILVQLFKSVKINQRLDTTVNISFNTTNWISVENIKLKRNL
jgi:hypothetical protein